MSERAMVRAFLAVPSEPMWVESARGLVAGLRKSLPEATWTRPESWHLTLKFLGEVSREALSRFVSALEPLASETVPGEVRTAGAVVFPPRGPARVLGVGFAASEILEGISRLAAGAERAAPQIAGEASHRAFHPHVSFVRIRRPWPKEAVEAFRRDVEAWNFPVWQARSCVLFESLLGPEGAEHTAVGEWSFIGGERGVRA